MASSVINGAHAIATPISGRIDALDVLRGLALFGVVAVNLDTQFRVSLFEQFLQPAETPSAFDVAGDYLLRGVLEGKAFALFSLLFGVGLEIQFERLRGYSLLARRLAILFVFGVLQYAFIMSGEVLTEYAVSGFIVLLFLSAALRVLALATGTALAIYLGSAWIAPPLGFVDGDWLAAHAAAAREIYSGGSFREIVALRLRELPQIAQLHAFVLPRTVGLMLLGVLVWRTGALAKRCERRRVVRGMAIASICLGAALWLLIGEAFALMGAPIARTMAALAPVVLATGYAALVIWTVDYTRFRWLLAWAAPVGRMALTNYVAHSAVLGMLFYSYGFRLIGKLSVAEGFVAAIAIYGAQVFASAIWARRHRSGPLEWVWRALTYGVKHPYAR